MGHPNNELYVGDQLPTVVADGYCDIAPSTSNLRSARRRRWTELDELRGADIELVERKSAAQRGLRARRTESAELSREPDNFDYDAMPYPDAGEVAARLEDSLTELELLQEFEPTRNREPPTFEGPEGLRGSFQIILPPRRGPGRYRGLDAVWVKNPK